MPSNDAHQPIVIDPTLTPEQLATITRRAFGADAPLREASPVGGGTVNEVWRIAVSGEPDAILRVAPSPEAAAHGPSWLTPDGLRREQAAIALLPHLASILPRTICFDPTRHIVARDWVMQTIVPGRPWSEIDVTLDDQGRIGLWRKMGAICRAIHDVHAPAFGPAHAPSFPTWTSLLEDDAAGLREDARRFGIDPAPFAQLLAAVKVHRGLLDRVEIPALIHSDLGPRHCFIERDAGGAWQIVGLIDLEFARFADPLSESMIVDMMTSDHTPDADLCDAFWAGYGPFETPPGAERRAQLYAAIALGWVATDLARLGQLDEISEVLVQLDGRVEALGEGPHESRKPEGAFGG